MDLKQLNQFIVLSETLSFSQAALKLHIAQPALSISIRKLEEEWGTPLFIRTSRDIQLTEAGKIALNDAKKSIFHAERAKQMAKQVDGGEIGTLNIAFVGSAIINIIPQLFSFFCQQNPHIRLELLESTNSNLIEMVKRGEMDLAFARLPIGYQPNLSVMTVEDDCFMVALRSDHPLVEKESISLADLSQYPFIQYTGEIYGGLDAVIYNMFQAAGYMPQVAHKAVQVQTVVSLVEGGLGLALVPGIVSDRLSRSVVLKPLKDTVSPIISLGLIYQSHSESDSVKKFCEVASQWLLKSRDTSS